MKQNRIVLEQLNFGSFIKLNSIIYLSLGLFLGLLFSIINIFGGNVKSTFNGREITGIQEFIFDIIGTPVLIIFMGIIFSLIMFLPFKLALKVTKGININGSFLGISKESEFLMDGRIKESNKIEEDNQ